MSLTVSLEVPARAGGLPSTGASVELLLAAALLLLLVGIVAVRMAAR